MHCHSALLQITSVNRPTAQPAMMTLRADLQACTCGVHSGARHGLSHARLSSYSILLSSQTLRRVPDDKLSLAMLSESCSDGSLTRSGLQVLGESCAGRASVHGLNARPCGFAADVDARNAARAMQSGLWRSAER